MKLLTYASISLQVILLPVLTSVSEAQITQGPLNPGTVATGACSFSYSSMLGYTPTANVITSNNSYASVTHCGCCDANTNCLMVSNFGFTIPATATISGIIVRIEKRAGAGAIIQDNGLRLMKGGAEAGSSLASAANWPSSDTYTTYGSCNNLWGTTWTPAQINASNFGLYFAAIDYTCAGNTQSFIDNIQISVCYFSTLPVELNYVKAVRNGSQVNVVWETASETNNEKFIIERSEDGENYTEIGTVAGAGNSTVATRYSFTDFHPAENEYYYRLSQRDFNGNQQYFTPVEITENPALVSISAMYWSNQQLHATILSDARLPVIIRIYSVTGELIHTIQEVLINGKNEWIFSLPPTSGSFYMVSIQPGNEIPVNTLVFFTP